MNNQRRKSGGLRCDNEVLNSLCFYFFSIAVAILACFAIIVLRYDLSQVSFGFKGDEWIPVDIRFHNRTMTIELETSIQKLRDEMDKLKKKCSGTGTGEQHEQSGGKDGMEGRMKTIEEDLKEERKKNKKLQDQISKMAKRIDSNEQEIESLKFQTNRGGGNEQVNGEITKLNSALDEAKTIMKKVGDRVGILEEDKSRVLFQMTFSHGQHNISPGKPVVWNYGTAHWSVFEIQRKIWEPYLALSSDGQTVTFKKPGVYKIYLELLGLNSFRPKVGINGVDHFFGITQNGVGRHGSFSTTRVIVATAGMTVEIWNRKEHEQKDGQIWRDGRANCLRISWEGNYYPNP